MNILEILAQALCYPATGRERELRESLDRLAASSGQPHHEALDARTATRALETFLDSVEQLDLGSWEELYTRTFDLNPPSAPYVGYQAWGDKYQRGELLAELGRRQREAGVDMEGELSDHLVPVLRYLATGPEPLPRLLQIMAPAVEKMRAGVEGLDAQNPYLHLLDAVAACTSSVSRAAGDSAKKPESHQEQEPAGVQLTVSCHPDLTRRES